MTEKEENSKTRPSLSNGGLTGLLFFQPKKHQNDGKRDEHTSANLRHQRQLRFHALGLILPKKGLGSAAHGADAAAFAALRKTETTKIRADIKSKMPTIHCIAVIQGSLLSECTCYLTILSRKKQAFPQTEAEF